MPKGHTTDGTKRIKATIGDRFGRLVVLAEAGHSDDGLRRLVLCQCDCGKTTITVASRLTQRSKGGTKSCGCLHSDTLVARQTKHSLAGSHIYLIWNGMHSRCYNPNHPSYHRYGGRGIRVCERWHDFQNFYADMGDKPSPSHSLDRYPNQDGNYEPGNVRWATRTEQARNKGNNYLVEFHGESKTLAEWEEVTGIPQNTLWQRLERSGWSVERTLTEPLQLTGKKKSQAKLQEPPNEPESQNLF